MTLKSFNNLIYHRSLVDRVQPKNPNVKSHNSWLSCDLKKNKLRKYCFIRVSNFMQIEQFFTAKRFCCWDKNAKWAFSKFVLWFVFGLDGLFGLLLLLFVIILFDSKPEATIYGWGGHVSTHFYYIFFCKMLVNIYNILANFLLIEIKKKFDDFCWVLHFCLYFIFASTFILVRCNLSGESFQTNSQCPPVEVSLSVCISALLFWLHWNTHTIFSQLG